MSVFDRANPDEVERAWTLLQLYSTERGETVLSAGVEEAASIVSLQARLRFLHEDGTVIAEAREGAVAGIGQIVWTGRPMPHTVEITDPGEVLVVSREAIDTLRAEGSPVVEGWEIYALDQTCSAFRELNEAIGDLAAKTRMARRSPPSPSLLDELLQMSGLVERLAPRVDIDQALARSALFEDADPQALLALEPVLHQSVFEPGMVLGEQFEVADSMHFVVDGEVQLATTLTPNHEPSVIATASAGALVGYACVLGTVRLVSLITSRRTTVLSMRAEDVRDVVQESTPRGTALRIALLRASADAMASAEIQVRRLLLERSRALKEEAAAFLKAGQLAKVSSFGYEVRR